MKKDAKHYRGWKFILAWLLLPFAIALALGLSTLVQEWWMSDGGTASWFGLLSIGALGWLIAYLILPKPFWLYVFGHEFTHVLAIYMSQGKVYDLKVTSQGGHVRSDKMNWWIALAPYCVPLYSLVWILLWWCLSYYFHGEVWRAILFLGLGMTWGFHVTFTLYVMRRDQPDLVGQGYFFSLVTIFCFNALFVSVLFVVLSSEITVGRFLEVMWHQSILCYSTAWALILKAIEWAREYLMALN
jgi:hypothetical protein